MSALRAQLVNSRVCAHACVLYLATFLDFCRFHVRVDAHIWSTDKKNKWSIKF
jgi:hypothetical protein